MGFYFLLKWNNCLFTAKKVTSRHTATESWKWFSWDLGFFQCCHGNQKAQHTMQRWPSLLGVLLTLTLCICLILEDSFNPLFCRVLSQTPPSCLLHFLSCAHWNEDFDAFTDAFAEGIHKYLFIQTWSRTVKMYLVFEGQEHNQEEGGLE